MGDRIRIGVSNCLLGQKVRYDGGQKLDTYVVETLGTHLELLGICPEVEYGLPVPREPMRLVGDRTRPHLVTIHGGVDHTAGMYGWAKQRIAELEDEGLSGLILKTRSPSCGIKRVKIFTPSGAANGGGTGIFARAFMDRFPLVPIEDEERLGDPSIRENFIERVFVYHRWRQFKQTDRADRDLIRFHTAHKLLVLSHSTRHYTHLGRLVAQPHKQHGDGHETYLSLLMEGIRLAATRGKHTNVLHHAMGYFKKQLSGAEKAELIELIELYHSGHVPLIAPVVLLNHYVRKYDQEYLAMQYYLNPHPKELMLRNHA